LADGFKTTSKTKSDSLKGRKKRKEGRQKERKKEILLTGSMELSMGDPPRQH
jgi:hypothetical protein